MKYKIGDKVKITTLEVFKDKVGVIKAPDEGTVKDYDWIVDIENWPVPVWDFELELVGL